MSELLTADQARPERLHPLALLSGIGRAIGNVVGGIAAGGFLAAQGRLGIALMIFAGIAIVTVGGLFLHWRRFSFRVGSDAIRIDSGILSRNQRTIPFDRVADVSIAQGPLQRVFGIARVTLETGGSAAGQEEGVLDGIALHRAEALREFVRARRGGAAAGIAASAEAASEVEAAPLFAMDLRRVLTLGLFNFSLALFAGLFGASQTVGDALGIDPFKRRFWTPILQQSGLGEWLLAHRIGLAISGLAVLVLAGIATGLVRTTLREYGFRLDRTGNGFRRRRGLLTKTDVSLPARRIQAALVTTGPIRDRFGWRAFKVLSLAGEAGGGQPGKEGRDDHVLAPLATDEEIAPIASSVGLSLPDEATSWRPVSRGHLTSFMALVGPLLLLLAMVGTAVAAIGGGEPVLLLVPPVIAVASFLLLALLRWFEWRNTAYTLEAGRLLVRTGWWCRRTLLIPLRNVQSVTLKESSLSRRFGIASLAVDVAGGRSGGQILPSLPRDQASLLLRDLLSAQP